MTFSILSDMDLSAAPEPEPTADSRQFLEGWLRYQRHEFLRKLRDLTPEGLVAWSIPPVELSVLGLVRHMTQMEHHYLAWGLGGGEQEMVYGEDDYAGGSVHDEPDHRYVRGQFRSSSGLAQSSFRKVKLSVQACSERFGSPKPVQRQQARQHTVPAPTETGLSKEDAETHCLPSLLGSVPEP